MNSFRVDECPQKFNWRFGNSHFFSFRVRLTSCSLWRAASKWWLCSSTDLPFTRISFLWQRAPSVPSRTCEIRFWKCSGAELIQNGRRLKQSLPNGVMKVVSLADSGDKPICQNPELASSLLKMVAPASWAKVWWTPGKGSYSLRILSLSLVKSTHMRTLSLAYGTTTIPAHHSVGSSTFKWSPFVPSVRVSRWLWKEGEQVLSSGY